MEGRSVFMIDQNALPFKFRIHEAKTCHETCKAIRTMITRGAGAIGAAAGFAMAQAYLEAPGNLQYIENAREEIKSTRPTARNLFYAVEKVFEAGRNSIENAVNEAQRLAEENIADALKIAEFGDGLIKDGSGILTHCNAGWLGFVDWGSALAPIYRAHRRGKNIFVYADETRPRSQGARLTAWELSNEGVPHIIVPDNAGAYLMSKGKIDMVIVGADRIAANGDTANKIGTFEKAIVAKEFGIPFYVAAPFSTFDFSLTDGSLIDIEQRSQDEVLFQSGPDEEGVIRCIRVAANDSGALNPAFDVTPAKYITAYITEKGMVSASESFRTGNR
jgi:S-methyl-5-thioribose-1-phosphate isomerase